MASNQYMSPSRNLKRWAADSFSTGETVRKARSRAINPLLPSYRVCYLLSACSAMRGELGASDLDLIEGLHMKTMPLVGTHLHLDPDSNKGTLLKYNLQAIG